MSAQSDRKPASEPSVRAVERVVRGQPASDGAGVKLLRVIGSGALQDLDPFLLLDEFRSDDASDYIAGFPAHPHRGFETVTYMLAGRMRHGDNQGNKGLLGPGSVQWMTAGRGIVHSEMPEQEAGLMWGFQLWVNLPGRDKLTAPRYQDIAPELIPEVEAPGAKVRVIAGEFGGTRGPVQAPTTEPVYLDVRLEEGAGAKPVSRGELGVLSRGSQFRAHAVGEAAKFLLVAGRPLNEPVARYGPFVMNTQAEIRQALLDFQTGRL